MRKEKYIVVYGNFNFYFSNSRNAKIHSQANGKPVRIYENTPPYKYVCESNIVGITVTGETFDRMYTKRPDNLDISKLRS